MPLAAGTKLGPFEILAPIGAGGMGEVQRPEIRAEGKLRSGRVTRDSEKATPRRIQFTGAAQEEFYPVAGLVSFPLLFHSIKDGQWSKLLNPVDLYSSP